MAEYKLSYTANEINRRLGEIDNAVKYTEQTLTEDQKAQARANIGADGVSSWNDLEDKPFSKEVDSSVYTTSTFEQLEYPKTHAEDYTHGTKLCETTYMPGSVSVTVDNFVSNKSVPLVPISQYYALGNFEINGRKFAIYSAYMGRGYELYVLGMSSDGLYGQTFRISDIAKIKYLPTEYINITDVMSILKLPATYAGLSDRPFYVDPFVLDENIYNFVTNSNSTSATAGYFYISENSVSDIRFAPNYIDANLFGSKKTFKMTQVNDEEWISNELDVSTGRMAMYVINNNGMYSIYVLANGAKPANPGYIENVYAVKLMDSKALPMDEITSSVIAALPRYNGEVADV